MVFINTPLNDVNKTPNMLLLIDILFLKFVHYYEWGSFYNQQVSITICHCWNIHISGILKHSGWRFATFVSIKFIIYHVHGWYMVYGIQYVCSIMQYIRFYRLFIYKKITRKEGNKNSWACYLARWTSSGNIGNVIYYNCTMYENRRRKWRYSGTECLNLYK